MIADRTIWRHDHLQTYPVKCLILVCLILSRDHSLLKAWDLQKLVRSLPSQRARMRPSLKPEDASQVHHISAVSRENTNCFLVSRHRRVTYTDVTIEWLICLFRRCLATAVQCCCQNARRLCGQRACLVHCSLHINIGPRASSRVYPLPHRVGCRPASASVDSAPG